MPLRFLYFLFCYYIYLFAFVFSLCHPHHAVVIQRKEVDCPALPKACTCTQDSKGPPGPAGPPVRHTHTHTHFGYWASLTSAALHFIVCLLEWNMDNDQTWSHICITTMTQTSFFLHFVTSLFTHITCFFDMVKNNHQTSNFLYHCQKHHDSNIPPGI